MAEVIGGDLAGWGEPGCPLLPMWHIERLGNKPLPASLVVENPNITSYADLHRFWETSRTPVSREQLNLLSHEAQKLKGIEQLEVVAAGLPEHWPAFLPLKVRTQNCLRRSRSAKTGLAMTAGELLSINNFGYNSLLDLMCVLEAHGAQAVQANPAVNIASVLKDAASNQESQRDFKALRESLAYLQEATGAVSMADLILSPKLADALMATTAELDKARTLRLDSILEDDDSPVVRLESCIRATLVDTRPDHIQYFLERKSATSRTLAEIGDEAGVSRERIRQIEANLQTKLAASCDKPLSSTASLVNLQLPPIATQDAVHLAVTEIAGRLTGRTKAVAETLINDRLRRTTNGELSLSPQGVELFDSIDHALTQTEDDVGIVRFQLAIQQTDPELIPLQDQLADALGIVRVGNRYARRDTLRVRAKGAVLDIGRPATRGELAELVGVDESSLGSTLSNIDSIGRSTKEHWGLLEWIDDVYEGIPAEIEQRIDEYGGAVSLELLLADIPERFQVSPQSVRAYVATQQFVLVNGMVSRRSIDNLNFRNVDDVADRNSANELTWDFPMEDRYLDGYSILGFPPELARELGCGANDRQDVPVEYPPQDRHASVIWQLSSISGPSIGKVAGALRTLGLQQGDNVTVTITNNGTLRFDKAETTTSKQESYNASQALQRMRNRRSLL